MSLGVTVISTTEWGAQPARVAHFALTTPRYVIVHHTDTHNPPGDLSHGTRAGAMDLARQIQSWHLGRGWSDSGHNFLNTTGGFVLEGRHGTLDAVAQGKCVQSAHARQDTGLLARGNESPGIENEGNFMTFAMGQVQWNSLVTLCTGLCRELAIEPGNIRGHREFSDTDCPGDWLFARLPGLRQQVATQLGVALTTTHAFGLTAAGPLVFGGSGPGILALQQRLLACGYSPGSLDGIFGENTRAAIVAFQRARGLQANGKADVATCAALDAPAPAVG